MGFGGHRRSPPTAQRLQADQQDRERDQTGRGDGTEGASDGHAAAEFLVGAVRPRQHHRRPRIW